MHGPDLRTDFFSVLAEIAAPMARAIKKYNSAHEDRQRGAGATVELPHTPQDHQDLLDPSREGERMLLSSAMKLYPQKKGRKPKNKPRHGHTRRGRRRRSMLVSPNHALPSVGCPRRRNTGEHLKNSFTTQKTKTKRQQAQNNMSSLLATPTHRSFPLLVVCHLRAAHASPGRRAIAHGTSPQCIGSRPCPSTAHCGCDVWL